MKKILLLTDHRRSFYSTVATQRTLCSMNVNHLVEEFKTVGYKLEVSSFSEVDFSADFEDVPFLYTSSEDPGLHYKSYIEDVVLALETLGGRALPAFRFLRAHHNKSMMELLRYQIFPKDASWLQTRTFGTYEELCEAELGDSWPKVIKMASGAGSMGVERANDRAALLSTARRLSRTMPLMEGIREHRSRLLWKGYVGRSLNRKKFIVQNMISGLAGDFKVLRYGSRYYPLYRHNRPGDFRASGSGILTFDLPQSADHEALLDYAEEASEAIGTPLTSLDIGFDGKRFHLVEFQCLNFGTLAAEKSSSYFTNVNGQWRRKPEACNLERILAEAIGQYLDSEL